MYKYIVRRLLLLIPVLLGVSLLVFTIMSLTPGDPAQLILGENAPREAIEQLRVKMGLDKPFLVQYLRFVWNAIHGDFGTSYTTGREVFKEIFARFPATLELALSAMFVAVGIAIPVGILSATRQYSLLDNVSMILALVGVSMPVFWQGLMLILLFAVKLMLLPSGGNETLKSLILPSITLGTMTAAIITRMTRSSMLEVIRQDYIRTARAKGLTERVVVYKHGLRATLTVLTTQLGADIGYLLGGTIIMENVFGMPGIGSLAVKAINTQDRPIIIGVVMLGGFFIVIMNLIVDLVHIGLEPRLRTK